MIAVPPALRRAAVLRLGVVLAVLVGIALVQGGQCSAAMPMGAMEMTMARPVTADRAKIGSSVLAAESRDHSVSLVVHDAQHADSATHESAAGAVSDRLEPAPAGLVMACLAVFLALLAALALPRYSGTSYLVLPIRRQRAVGPSTILTRKPSLAELCILRT